MTVDVTFAGSGDAFGSGGSLQACIHVQAPGHAPVLLDCGATSLVALKTQGLDPNQVSTVFVTHLHVDHFGGVPLLILEGQFNHRTAPLTVAGPVGTKERLTEALEVMFPGSSRVTRGFAVDVVELSRDNVVDGIRVRTWPVDHGVAGLGIRLGVAGRTIAYTGDTAWTEALVDLAAGSDLFIAEAYCWDRDVPYHLRHSDLLANRDRITSRRTILTHMSADMLAHVGDAAFETAYDGQIVRL